MELRSKLELPKLKINDIVRVRILSVGVKHIVVELYGKEVIIKAEDLQHTYIVNCKELYSPGKYIIEDGEYTGKVIAFPKGNSGIMVQLDVTNITCLARVPARFNDYPHYLDKVLIKVTEIRENKKMIYAYLMRIIN